MGPCRSTEFEQLTKIETSDGSGVLSPAMQADEMESAGTSRKRCAVEVEGERQSDKKLKTVPELVSEVENMPLPPQGQSFQDQKPPVLPRVPSCPSSAEKTLYNEYLDMMVANGAKFSEWNNAPGPDDCLLVIDMQNDFLPADVAPAGGAFGVAEGGATVKPIVDLIERFSQRGSMVVATKDYHPLEHSSFTTHGGPFPPHCVQGSPGSRFFPPVGEALAAAKASRQGAVEIAFKGFAEETDSFGSLPYDQAYFKEGMPHCKWEVGSSNKEHFGTCCGPWTGAFCLQCGHLEKDIDAPPDVMAVMRRDKRPLSTVLPALGRGGRLLIVGLAFDFCIIDTAVNASKMGYDVFIAPEACRAAHIPGMGKHGSGFLTDPSTMAARFEDHNIKLVPLLA